MIFLKTKQQIVKIYQDINIKKKLFTYFKVRATENFHLLSHSPEGYNSGAWPDKTKGIFTTGL